jgi:hypothetical protein
MAEQPEEVLPEEWFAAVPNCRSKKTSMRATVITGRANSSRNEMIVIIHVNTGMRMRRIPGARMLTTVTMKLIAPTSEPMPVMIRPIDQ